MVRYADDCVVCFQYKEEAEGFLESVRKRLAKFGLELSEEKTKIIEFGKCAIENRKARGEGKPETFNFLGFTHYCGITKQGKHVTKRKTEAKGKNTRNERMAKEKNAL